MTTYVWDPVVEAEAADTDQINALGAEVTAHAAALAAASLLTVPVYKLADQSFTAQTTLQNDAHLALPVAAAGVYAIRADLFTYTPAAADIKIGWSYPSGLLAQFFYRGVLAGGTAITDTYADQTSVPEFEGGGSFRLISIHGTVFVGATAGTLQLKFAQRVSDAGSTGLIKGSNVALLKMG